MENLDVEAAVRDRYSAASQAREVALCCPIDYDPKIDKWQAEPWQVVKGIEFRSVTVTAEKGKQGACWEANQAVIYKGPWKQVEDDDGHVLRRGERIAVCEKTFRILTGGPYAEAIIPILPREAPLVLAPFDCTRTVNRHPRESKGLEYDATQAGGECCVPGQCC